MAPDAPLGAPQQRTFAEKLTYLFDHVRREDGAEYTGKMSASHLSELRRGIKTNPTLRVLQALADFLQVRVAYFFDDDAAAQTKADLELRAAMRDVDVTQMATPVADLSDPQRMALQRLLT